MNADCPHHRDCDRVFPLQHVATQRVLINQEGILRLGPVPPTPPQKPANKLRRSSMPKAVRNIVEIATFSTSNRALTSFFRFPPEIRIQIYEHLIICDGRILYGICPDKRTIVERNTYRLGWNRHAMFPAMLECCRRINLEGSDILYGRNVFQMERLYGWPEVRSNWFPRRCNIDPITRLHLEQHHYSTCAQDNNSGDLMDLFPNLTEFVVTLKYFSLDDWKAFIVRMNPKLQDMRLFVLRVAIASSMEKDTKNQH